MKGHKLEIVKPGRGAWFAQCSCGESYRSTSRTGAWTPGEVSGAKIREMHRAHKEQAR